MKMSRLYGNLACFVVKILDIRIIFHIFVGFVL
jgi:hypothetical protein